MELHPLAVPLMMVAFFSWMLAIHSRQKRKTLTDAKIAAWYQEKGPTMKMVGTWGLIVSFLLLIASIFKLLNWIN